MKLRARNVAWLLPLFLTACFNKPHQQPAQEFAPPVANLPKPPATHPELPASAVTIPNEPLDTNTDAIVEEAAKPVVRRRKPVTKATSENPDNVQSAPGNSQQSENESGEVPAIGVLSSGGDPSGGDPTELRSETAVSITDTERSLKSIGRPLNGEEQKTAAQIRQYIRQAKKALNSGDVEGARTLAAKAKALLSELNG
jgi:hypothetical protein